MTRFERQELENRRHMSQAIKGFTIAIGIGFVAAILSLFFNTIQ